MPTTTAAKLLIKPDYRVLLLQPPAGYPEALGPLPDGVVITDRIERPLNLVLLFAEQRSILDRLMPRLEPVLSEPTLFWVAYPKGGSKAGTDLNRDRLWEAMAPLHWTGVTLIALDTRWSAMRFRPDSGQGSSPTRSS